MHSFTFCTNADCNKLLTDFELNRIPIGKNGAIKGTKFKFCKRCRAHQNLIKKIRCIKCRDTFYPTIVDENTGEVKIQHTIFKMICDDCYKEKERIRSRTRQTEMRAQFKIMKAQLEQKEILA